MNGRGYVTNDKGGYRAARAAKKKKREERFVNFFEQKILYFFKGWHP